MSQARSGDGATPPTPPTPLSGAAAGSPLAEQDGRASTRPSLATRGRLSLVPQPSFPKAVVSEAPGDLHAEWRAGLRFGEMRLGGVAEEEHVVAAAGGSGGGADVGCGGGEGWGTIKLGFGFNTAAGVKENSIEAKVLGCGVLLGQKVGISVFDTEISVDFAKLFGGGDEASEAAVPAASAGAADFRLHGRDHAGT